MTLEERLTAAETRLAAAESRIAALEQRPVFQYVPTVQPGATTWTGYKTCAFCGKINCTESHVICDSSVSCQPGISGDIR